MAVLALVAARAHALGKVVTDLHAVGAALRARVLAVACGAGAGASAVVRRDVAVRQGVGRGRRAARVGVLVGTAAWRGVHAALQRERRLKVRVELLRGPCGSMGGCMACSRGCGAADLAARL